MELLQGIEGLEPLQGLQRSGGKASFYISMLRKMAASQAEAVQRVREQLAAHDRQSAERSAHTLKGVAGNLGAVALQNSAGALESSLHAGADEVQCQACTSHTEQVLSKLLQALQETPGFVLADTVSNEAAPATETDRQRAPAVLEQLKKCLREDDASALSIWEENASLLGSLLPQAKAVQAAIENFDYEVALDLLT